MSAYVRLLCEATAREREYGERKGQALMNALWDISPDTYHAVMDEGMDPFYSENPVPAHVYTFISERLD